MAGSFRSELEAVRRVAQRPQYTALEIQTLKTLQAMSFADAQREATPPEVRAARAAEALAAIRVQDAEAVRAKMWAGFSMRVRRMVCAIGGLDKARADDALSKFDALERGTIYCAMDAVIRELESAKRCMVGGDMPKTVPAYGHVSNGIASIGVVQ